MNDISLGFLLGVIFFILVFSSPLPKSVHALSDSDRILNELCEFNKMDNPNYDCTFILDSSSANPLSQSKTFQSADSSEHLSSITSNTLETSNEDSGDGITSILLGVVFLIIAPIIFVQVWKNHNPAKTSYRKSSTRHRKDSAYEKFSQKQQEQNEERRRQDKFQQEQSRQRQEQQEREDERQREERREKERRERSEREKQQKNTESNTRTDSNLQKYHDLLRVKYGSTPSEIKAAYRKQIKFYHPDNYQNRTEEIQKDADEKTQEIIDAYGKLKDAGRAD